MVNIIYEKSIYRNKLLINNQANLSGRTLYVKGYRSEVYTNILKFLRQLMIINADPNAMVDEFLFDEFDSENKIFESKTRKKMDIEEDNQLTREREGVCHVYLGLLEKGLSNESLIDTNLQSTASSCLLELISLGPSSLSRSYENRISWIKPFMSVTKLEVRNCMAHVLGIVSTSELENYSERCKNVQELIKEFIDIAKVESRQVSIDYHHGSIIALGYIISRLIFRYPTNYDKLVPDNILAEAIKIIIKDLDSTKNLYLNGSAKALGEIGRYTTSSHISMGDLKYTEKVLSLFYEFSSSLKQVDVHFTIGEAITFITGGWKKINSNVMEGVLNKIFTELLPSGKAPIKKAVCIWMLCLVKFCYNVDIIKVSLPKIHGVFSLLLADRDEFVQDVASKGIGLVYELGDQGVKEQLVNSLVEMFSEGKRPKETIDRDTQLFDSNSLGQTPDGSAITTYQSILSLASDMNQPELVYKFMQLASHNAMWQTRKGAAFGFSHIIVQAENELKPYLKDLIPRLYRYQFDPNPKVSEAMTSIWKALIKDPKKATEEYFNVIVKDLLVGIGDRLWRTHLLQGRSIQELEPHLQILWNNSASKTCRTLTKVTVKYCDPENVSVNDGRKIINIIVPFLLTKGLVSDAEDVRKFSLRAILKICKSAKELLKSHISEMIGTLLEGLSSMEPQVMNYLSFHVEKYNVTQEQYENTRLSATKMSPIMEGIESCIDNIDENVMKEFEPKLLQLIRKGIGLPTKAGCARLLVTLSQRKAPILRPFADNIMKALSGALLDPSPAIRKSYAVAIGYVAHLSTDNTLIKFMSHLKKVYCDNSEQEIRSITGITVLEISRHASDELKRIYVEIMPLVYYGMHDPEINIKNVWTEVWDENTSGSTGAIKLYLNELIELLSKLLESPSWTTKRQAALTIADEALIEALTSSSIFCKEYFESNEYLQLDEISKVLIRETKKTNKQYKRHCMDNLGLFADAFSDKLDIYEQVKDFLIELAIGSQDPNEMDEDDANDRPLFLLVKASAMKCLGLVWSKNRNVQKQHSKELGTILASSLGSGKNVWNVRLGVLSSLEKFVEKLDLNNNNNDGLVIDEETIINIFEGLKEGLLDAKYLAIRTASLQSLKKVIEKIKGTQLNSLPTVQQQLLKTISIAENDPIPIISK
ncbi:6467_t:CDS:10 [Diversispora eburnea]|uniref:6467_t:CDS:1 n=1 Tax=Diversispora eburnea TaxID=1213867 RepID=A0A9N9B1T6_9GLOM|nr:6467_t:CDS:10 [Diversispora eburnea]